MSNSKYLLLPLIFLSGFLISDDLKEKLETDLDPLMKKVITWRHNIHQFPELGNREYKTSKKVIQHLESLGIEVESNSIIA